jgi:hypothetical protein
MRRRSMTCHDLGSEFNSCWKRIKVFAVRKIKGHLVPVFLVFFCPVEMMENDRLSTYRNLGMFKGMSNDAS